MQSLDVKGMSCEHCVAAVTAAVQEVVAPGATVSVDLNSGKVLVDDDVVPADVLVEAIESEGYEAAPTGDKPA